MTNDPRTVAPDVAETAAMLAERAHLLRGDLLRTLPVEAATRAQLAETVELVELLATDVADLARVVTPKGEGEPS